MPTYKVIAKGFMHKRTYDPLGKRRTLTTDKPLKPVPSWLTPIEEVKETAAEKKARLAAEKAAAQKQQADKVETDAVTFTEAPAPTQPGSAVTTL